MKPRGIPRLTYAALPLLLAACTPGDKGAVDVPQGAPVVLISIDTLRADRLPAWGYGGVETPAIDGLVRDGVRFENAYSHIPLTLPSHSSLLTGLLPPEHGVRDNVGYSLDRDAVAAGTLPWLPRLLHEQGYQTGGAVSTFVLRGRTGMDEAFDFYEDSIEFRPGVGLGGMQRPGQVTWDLARDWLDQAADGPFFLFFHLYEPHTPYTPPEPFASRYEDPYDGEVATADAVVGELLAELRRLGVYDEAIVVLLSDHGEGLGDHGEDEHGVLLYTTTLHVPLVVKLPHAARGGEVVAEPAQLVDVVPTVLDLLGLDVPEGLPGSSLLDLAGAPPRRVYSETFYPRLHFGWSELTSLLDDHWHYVSGPDPELYDLAQDPGEQANVLRENRRVYAELRDALEPLERALEAPAETDEETRRALAALGYVGGGPANVSGPLPDPKSRLHTLVDLRDGFRFHAEKKHAEAAAAFRRTLAENPGMVDAWEFLARSLEALGERREALDAYKKALEISGGAAHLAVSAASLMFDLKLLGDAEHHARLALDSHPSFAHGLLAQIAVRRGDLETAQREAQAALDPEAPRVGPLVTLAGVANAAGRFEDALARVKEAEEVFASRSAQDPELIRGLHLEKGKALANLGRPAEAEAEFMKEIELFPDQVYAYSNLAILYALTGRPLEVSGVLRRMVEAKPSAEAYAEAVKTLRILETPGADSLLDYALGLYPGAEELVELKAGG